MHYGMEKHIHEPAEHSTLAKVDQGRWGDRRYVERPQKVERGKRHSGCLDMHTETVLQTPWKKLRSAMKADK